METLAAMRGAVVGHNATGRRSCATRPASVVPRPQVRPQGACQGPELAGRACRDGAWAVATTRRLDVSRAVTIMACVTPNLASLLGLALGRARGPGPAGKAALKRAARSMIW